MLKKHTEKSGNWLKYSLFSVMVAALVFTFLPVPYTLYVQPNDGELRPADPITTQTPLEQCIDGKFENVTSIDILLATYDRQNTNTNQVEIFTLRDNTKNIIARNEFPSGSVKDNDYFPIGFSGISTDQKLCFLLSSKDATPQNGITYWLNSQSQPVLKVRSTVPLYKAIEQIASASRFNLPIWVGIALCLLYLCANIGALFLIWHEVQKSPQKVPKAASAHSRRARQKRI